jgi:ABC-type siderophore export system fused ATPase/permease subunit
MFSEVHKWRWATFHSAAGTGCWFFAVMSYSQVMRHLFSNSGTSWSEVMMFNMINLAISLFIYLMAGSISSVAASYFVTHLYSRMKLD